MPRIYLPLLPLPVLAAVVAFSACSSPPADRPATQLIPPAVAFAPPAPAALPAPAAPTGENAPTEEELRAFARPVAK
jgi:hypothetical protein